MEWGDVIKNNSRTLLGTKFPNEKPIKSSAMWMNVSLTKASHCEIVPSV